LQNVERLTINESYRTCGWHEGGNNNRDDESDSEGEKISHSTVQSQVWSLSAPPSEIDSGNNTQTAAILNECRSINRVSVVVANAGGRRARRVFVGMLCALSLPTPSLLPVDYMQGEGPEDGKTS
jgi:hypothetical protein